MNTTDPYAGFGTKQTHQSQPAVPTQRENNAGGYVFTIDPISQLKRFLTIGTAGGTYYVGQNELTNENGKMLLELTKIDVTHKQLVDTIVEISLEGRAKKQNPTLFALAIACQHGETASKQYARKQITKVVRTGTHLFIFVGYLKQFGGWSRGLRKAVGNWYVEKDADKLAYQLVKYRQREGFTHRDVLRLTHPKITRDTLPAEELDEVHRRRAVISWVTHGKTSLSKHKWPDVLYGFEEAQKEGADIPALLESSNVRLPWEALPDSAMNNTKVWDKMLDNGVPIGALLRQLPRLTQLEMLPQMGGRTDEVIASLLNKEALQRARIHPFSVLVALKTYQQGHGFRSTWAPTAKIVDALDEMFYSSFANVVPTGKRTMNALDVSGSMGWTAGGNLPLTCREVSAALAMVTVRTEPNHMTVGFTSGGSRGMGWRDNAALTDLPITARQRLDDVVRTISNLPFGGTDCSLPMVEATRRGLEIDTFVVYTDNETWAGNIHPFQALKQYRAKSGIDAKLIVVSITPSKFSIADPSDAGMLDISGFDAAVPTLISDFSAGLI